jgi:hypothetical protein
MDFLPIERTLSRSGLCGKLGVAPALKGRAGALGFVRTYPRHYRRHHLGLAAQSGRPRRPLCGKSRRQSAGNGDRHAHCHLCGQRGARQRHGGPCRRGRRTNPIGPVHLGCAALPAALATAALAGRTGRDLARAVSTAYDIGARVLSALGYNDASRRHSGGCLTNTFTATAAAGAMLRLDQRQVRYTSAHHQPHRRGVPSRQARRRPSASLRRPPAWHRSGPHAERASALRRMVAGTFPALGPLDRGRAGLSQ